MKQALSFDDVLLEPGKSIVESRNDVSLETDFLGYKFKLPIMSANMSTVTEYDMCEAMHLAGGLGVIHRMIPLNEQMNIVEKMKFVYPDSIVAATIDSKEGLRASKLLLESGCDIIFYDVAHAHSQSSLEFIKLFLNNFCNIPLVIGNIATVWAASDFFQEIFGHKNYHRNIAFKVGVGSGSQCTTRIVTGCGIPTLQSLFDIRDNLDHSVPIVADGGIKNSGDIVKSLAAGAKMVMVGSLLAGTAEAPGSVIKHQGQFYKVYRGSASFGQKNELSSNKATTFVEGEETLVVYKGHVAKILKQLEEGIKSGCSYMGTTSLTNIRHYAKFVQISNAGYVESTAHGA